jgi:hypothetical protein
MPFFAIDDKFHGNPKVFAAGNAAVGLYVRCGSYCADHLTDGLVPRDVARSYGTKAEISRLLRVLPGYENGFWIEVDGGYLMPDYLDYNPSREEVLANQATKHAKKVAAGKLGGIASGIARRRYGTNGEAPTEANGEPPPKQPANQSRSETKPRPDPTPGVTGCTDPTDDLPSADASSSSVVDLAIAIASRAVYEQDRSKAKHGMRPYVAGVASNMRSERTEEITQHLQSTNDPVELARRLVGSPVAVDLAASALGVQVPT